MSDGLVQNTPEWISWRRLGIGASEIAAIIGVSPYSTPYAVWLEKTGRSTGFAGNFATERGSELEAKARAKYELINMEDMPPAVAVHPKYDIVRVSLDGISEDRKKILEIKCLGEKNHQQVVAGKIPDHYYAQVQYQLAATGAESCDFFSFGADETHGLIKVYPDLEFQGMSILSALEFWKKYVLTDMPPPLTDKDVKIVDNDSSLLKLCETILFGRESMSKLELDSAKARFIEMGRHNKVKCRNVQVSTVNRAGKFSYHKLTISEDENAIIS